MKTIAKKLSLIASIILLFTVGTFNALSFGFEGQVKGVVHTAGKNTTLEVYTFRQQDSPQRIQFSPINTDTSNFKSYNQNAPVSEPAIIFLVGVGLFGLGLFGRKKLLKE